MTRTTDAVLTRWQLAQAAVIAGVGAPLIGALCHTLRWRVEGTEHYDGIVAQDRQHRMPRCARRRLRTADPPTSDAT